MERSSELEAVVQRMYGQMTQGDLSEFGGFISRQDGALMIGTDPREWWSGHGTIVDAFMAQLGEMRGMGVTVTQGDIRAYREGTIGWASDRPRFRFADGTEVEMRLTVVFRQEDDTWKTVQGHVSLGVSNEEAIGQELTIPSD
jgi:ketosteroid isomerase-like protein